MNTYSNSKPVINVPASRTINEIARKRSMFACLILFSFNVYWFCSFTKLKNKNSKKKKCETKKELHKTKTSLSFHSALNCTFFRATEKNAIFQATRTKNNRTKEISRLNFYIFSLFPSHIQESFVSLKKFAVGSFWFKNTVSLLVSNFILKFIIVCRQYL